LAAKKLDAEWVGWAARLSKGYTTATEMLDSEDVACADVHAEFRKGFLATVKKVFTESYAVPPARFQDKAHWCAWIQQLYKSARRTEDALKNGSRAEGQQRLEAMREQFHELHTRNGTERSNNYLYAFHQALSGPDLDANRLQSLQAHLMKAKLSRRANSNKKRFNAARSAWGERVEQALKDGKLSADEMVMLQHETEPFYREFGSPFE
jgi:hypothetical protein